MGKQNKNEYEWLWNTLLVMCALSSLLTQIGFDPDEKPLPPERVDSKFWEACQYTDDYHDLTLQLRAPAEREEQILDTLLTLLDLDESAYRLCATSDIPERDSVDAIAYATIKNGLHYIIYEWDLTTYSYLKSAKVIGHEIGHHFHRHTSFSLISPVEQELEADRFAGRSLYALGCSLSQSINTVSINYKGSRVHSPGPIRRKAMKYGWLEAAYEDKKANILQSTAHKYRTLSRTYLDRDLNQALNLITEFIHALGRQAFEEAYYMQMIDHWGPLGDFVSMDAFGGITDTRILSTPIVKDYVDHGDDSHLLTKILIQYLAVDPKNDPCQSGRVYDQFFWVKGFEDQWLITRTSIKEVNCYSNNHFNTTF